MEEGEKGPLSKVQVKGETVIPLEIRQALSLGEGTMLLWKVESPTRATIVRVRVKVEMA